ncbi:hypothetical protein ABH961_000026 [Bacillus sp. RC251]|uniref:ATP-binding protein n=1 Tax=Bacillus TaxID=1386 RepID=UPI00077A69C1|nr:ATP-binding protein [Bacillus wiedmannii]KXY09831.1 hypothetical protein AT260_04645 [Bacillus wiedmannii]PEM96467.1 hypothetical protein CN621_28115 [Bacillus wiedmannii]
MSGVDNLRGIDYQVSYSVLKLLEILLNECDMVDSIQFESLTELEEDMNIYKKDGTSEYIQIKKKAEGYNWTASELKEIFIKFLNKDDKGVQFTFISDGPGNRDVAELKKCLLNREELNEDLLKKFLKKPLTIEKLKVLIKKTSILTQSYTSVDSSLPGMVIKEKCINLLKTTSFLLSDSVENVYRSLWEYVFQLSQECKVVKIGCFKKNLEKIGLKISVKAWLDIPDISDFQGRKDEIDNITSSIKEIKKIVIKGISGVGKTTIMAKIAEGFYRSKKKVFWLELNKMYTVSNILDNISSFLYSNGLIDEANIISSCEIAERIPALIKILAKEEILLFIDSIDKANLEVVDFIEDLFKNIINIEMKGALIVTKIEGLNSYTKIDLITKKVFEYHLTGFSFEDTLDILKGRNNNYNEEDIYYFHKLIGGYPISVNFIKQLLSSNEINKNELSQLEKLSIESTHEYLFNRVFSILEKEEQDIALSISVFNYPFTEEEVKQVINSSVNPKYLLENLKKKNLVFHKNGYYDIHDSIKSLLMDILTLVKKEELHTILAKYYKAYMEQQFDKKGKVLYEDIFKWGYHLEFLKNSSTISPKCSILLHMNDDSLDAMWAIKRFGFPFAFNDSDLKSSYEIIEYLLDEKLIERNLEEPNGNLNTTKKYNLKNFDFFDSCFLSYLCLSRGISNHLGYIEVYQINSAFDIQGLTCPWEHCIEHMPLPPLTKKDYEDRIIFLKDMFLKGAYDDKPEELRNRFLDEIATGIPEDAPDEPDIELEECRCPEFGHCCPGGKEQSEYCRGMME